jgi:FtsZ-binding cell division protein ZapB
MNHNQELTPTDKDWYNAGIMAQRILQNDEIETLKSKFKKEEQDHYYTRCAWEETSKERDELKNQNLALQDRIRIMQEQLIIASEQVPKGAFEFYNLRKL